jgi:flavin reductase (DIM6/NTAB) family NADH-FMN oxidoreductase RutF
VQGVDTATVVLAEVVKFHVHEGVAGKSPSGKTVVDPVKLSPVSRLGGNTYDPIPALCGWFGGPLSLRI